MRLPERWMPLALHPVQDALYHCQARFVAVAAGRRSGKTEHAKRRLVMSLPLKKPWSDPRYFFAGPTQKQAKLIAWEDLLALVPDEWLDGGRYGRAVNRTELCIRTRFGSELHVVGLDKPSRIEGVAWDFGIIDESSDVKPGAFGRSIRPALADRNGGCWRIGVPKRVGCGAQEFHQFFRRCAASNYNGLGPQDNAEEPYEDGAAFTWVSADILTPEEIEHNRATLDPKDFREQYEASWESVGNRVFYAFEPHNLAPCQYDPSLPIIVGCDFNVDPMAWVLGHVRGNELHLFDELWQRDTNTPRALNTLAGKYRGHKAGWRFFGDAASRQRKTSAALTDYRIIQEHDTFRQMGASLHVPKSNPPVADRFAACNAMFCNAGGQRRMYVDPRCKRLIEDLESRSYKEGTSDPDDRALFSGHPTDAMGYVVYRLFPIRSEHERKQTVIAR